MSKTPLNRIGTDGNSFIRPQTGLEVMDMHHVTKDGNMLLHCCRIVCIRTVKGTGTVIDYLSTDHSMMSLPTSKRLAELEQDLPNLIIRCHQSFMINGWVEWRSTEEDRLTCHLLPDMTVSVTEPGVKQLMAAMVALRAKWHHPF